MNVNLSHLNRWNVLSGAVLMAVVIQACTIVPPSPPVEPRPNPVGDQSAKVRELRKQIRERDQRIEELESQLEALKLIDQDSIKQKIPIRPPTTLKSLE
ncbi:hypothetical protein YTPLAS72_13110 [Nitrospira sp.]|nr:hypothetical protein [Nitrospira sp.]GKS64007.1 hypothetical protein YTPLAS72_13110 [Nitrospira sp.]